MNDKHINTVYLLMYSMIVHEKPMRVVGVALSHSAGCIQIDILDTLYIRCTVKKEKKS